MKVKEHMGLLGMEVSDKVTGFSGVVTAVSFDLYGCIQTIVTPKVNKDGEKKDGKWLDIGRLDVTGKKPVMDVPDWDYGRVADGRKGAAPKPSGRF